MTKMNNDHGCSMCEAGCENFEKYYSSIAKKELVQYNYRAEDGELFTGIFRSVEIAREHRDAWLKRKSTF